MRVGLTTSIATAIAIGVLIASGGSNGTGCPLPAYPDATCTGVPAGTTLTAYTGPSTITTDNTVIDSKTIGCIEIAASNVTIRNSRITCVGSIYAVRVGDEENYGKQPLLIEDSEITCGSGDGGSGTALGPSNTIARRVNIHGCENGASMDQNITLEDSYLHDTWTSAEAHPDGIQFSNGHWNGSTYVCCSINLIIRHNRIYAQNYDGSPANAAIISERSVDENILIEDNLFAGGGYTVYCEQNATAINYRLLNNHFSTIFYPTVGFYAPATDCADETVSGNVYHDGPNAGQLVPLA